LGGRGGGNKKKGEMAQRSSLLEKGKLDQLEGFVSNRKKMAVGRRSGRRLLETGWSGWEIYENWCCSHRKNVGVAQKGKGEKGNERRLPGNDCKKKELDRAGAQVASPRPIGTRTEN